MNVSTSGRQHAIDSISCGRDHTLALLANGKVFGWGGDGSGRVPPGIPEYCSTSNPPTRAVEIDTRHPMACVSRRPRHQPRHHVTKRVLVWGANPAAAGGLGVVHRARPAAKAGGDGERARHCCRRVPVRRDRRCRRRSYLGFQRGRRVRPATPHLNSVPGAIASLAPASELTLGKGYMLARTRAGRDYMAGEIMRPVNSDSGICRRYRPRGRCRSKQPFVP